MKKQRKRTCAKMLCICLMLSLVPAPVSVAETGEAVGSHEHTLECYTWAEACTHEHTLECYSQEIISENEATPSEADEPVECSHICSAESGCITKKLNCQYEGSTPATAKTPLENEAEEETEQGQEAEIATSSNAQEGVTVESVQAMIDALPDAEEISADNAEDVKAQLEAIDEAKLQLSDEELATLDFSRYTEAAAVLAGLSAPMLTVSGAEEVSIADALTSALADSSIPKITLMGNIEIGDTLTVDRTVSLDLNGFVLRMTDSGSVIRVEQGGNLIIEDSNTIAQHKFTTGSNGLWVLDETNGTETVSGGVLTGGNANDGGGVYVLTGGQLTMTGGNIVGCSATGVGGGVSLEGWRSTVDQTTFTMTGGSITGCFAAATDGGGGVNVTGGTFTMAGGSIMECTAHNSDAFSTSYGGGVHIRNGGSFTMSGGTIQNCKSSGNQAAGGGVYVGKGQFTMNGGSITGCRAEGTSGNERFARGGGVYNYGGFTMSGGSIESDCTADGSGGGVYNINTLYANGGEIAGDVMNGVPNQSTGTITGSGGTRFSGKVTNNKGDYDDKSTIESGTFTGEVINDGGTILRGDFSGATLSGTLVITFDPDNGEPTSTQEVNWSRDGATLTAPTPVPTKEDYTLDGWYYDNSGTTTKWNFDTDKVKYTMTLMAHWKEQSTASPTAEVSTAVELTSALGNSAITTVKLTADITINATLTVNRTVTLDLDGYVLRYDSADRGSVFVVDGGHLTIQDSNTGGRSHGFTPTGDGLWILNETGGTETVSGGVITGGTGHPILLGGSSYTYYNYYGGGVYIANGQLTMTGGSIVGCSATDGGGVCMNPPTGQMDQFWMTGGSSIAGCVASGGGGGVYACAAGSFFDMRGTAVIHDCRCGGGGGGGVRAYGTFRMLDQAVIRGCTAESATQKVYGGGVYVASSSGFEMSGQAKIEDCQAISTSSSYASLGGGVYITNNTSLTLSGSAVIQNCTAKNSADSSEAYGGGVSTSRMRQITLEDSARIALCKAANGSGLYITGVPNNSSYGKFYADGGSVDGDVVLGNGKDLCTISGSGGTKFNGKVTVTPGSTSENGTFNRKVINNGTISGGTFNGEVINNGTISGGTFTGTVSNNGSITGGTFTGTVINSESGTIAEGVSINHLQFVVTFDANGGTGAMYSQNCTSGEEEKLFYNTFVRDTYDFVGWNTERDGSGTAYSDGQYIIVSKAMTLYAQWKKTVPSTPITPGGIRYIVEHYKASGSGYTLEETEYSTGKIGDTVTATPKTYDGFTYHPSISTSSGILKKISSAADIVTLKLYYDRTVYAVIVENDGNGSASAAPASAAMGDEITLTAAPNSGYRFKVWEVVSGGVTISNNKFIMPAGNVTVKAIFERKSSGGSGGGGGSRSSGSVSSKEQHRPSVVDDQAQWIQNGTDWKLVLSSGETAADRWVQKDGHWYWFKADGIMAHSGWLLYMGHWYYLNAGGDMITGWLLWNEHWYYLKADGIMAADEMTPDGYRIGPDGIWVP